MTSNTGIGVIHCCINPTALLLSSIVRINLTWIWGKNKYSSYLPSLDMGEKHVSY